MIALTLPWPPSLNHMYGRRGSRTFLKADGWKYKSDVANIVADMGIRCITKPVAVCVVAYMPDKRKRDIMNLEKITSDALTDAGVWLDDCLIHDYHITRHPDIVKGGMLKVVVRELDASER